MRNDACVKNTLETKPQLVQISAAWNSREGAPLGRNQYAELEIKKPKAKRCQRQKAITSLGDQFPIKWRAALLKYSTDRSIFTRLDEQHRAQQAQPRKS